MIELNKGFSRIKDRCKLKYEPNSILTSLSLLLFYSLITYLATSCTKPEQLQPVSVAEFSKFISETGYTTDAEKFGWSIIQEDVYNYKVDTGLTWQVPNGTDSARMDFPVTQVSFNDAIAYCKWSKTRLPSYNEFWTYTKLDNRRVNKNSSKILSIDEVNLIGNVWDLTSTENSIGEIRLAGGSFLCNMSTCNGTNPNRELFVDKATGNTHIGFSTIK